MMRTTRRLLRCLGPAAVLLTASLAKASDWTGYRHDNARSGRTKDPLDVAGLQQKWVVRTSTNPKTAWAGAAKWDAYKNVVDLKSMRDYDPVYHTTIAGGRLFFGSSVDHAVHCLDLNTGRELWQYTTDGPVRIAPTIANGKVYFGSDDGYAYCVDAAKGEPIWKFAPVEGQSKVVHDGAFISQWPCRTGVVVEQGTAYFCGSLFPWLPSYVCALDAISGRPEGTGRFVREHSGLTLEGPLLSSNAQLICPQGRVPPLLFRREDGTALGSLPGGGGCFVLVTDEGQVFHGPGNNKGQIYGSDVRSRASIASYPGAKAMVVAEKSAYLLTDHELTAVARVKDAAAWKVPCEGGLELIMAGDALVVGRRDAVVVFRAFDGSEAWRAPVPGRAYGLSVADGSLVVSTDEGVLACFAPPQGERAKSAVAGNVAAKPAAAKSDSPVKPQPAAPAATDAASFIADIGPFLEFTGPTSARVRWQTAQPGPTVLEYGESAPYRRIEHAVLTRSHDVALQDLRKDTLYHYRLVHSEKGQQRVSPPYECDMFFNHRATTSAAAGDAKPGAEDSPFAAAAAAIVRHAGVRRGICIDLGCGDGQLAVELARRSELRIVAVDDNLDNVRAARQRLREAKLYGDRVVVHPVKSLADLPFVEQSADLVVSARAIAADKEISPAALAVNLLRPGGEMIVGRPTAAGAGALPSFESFFAGGWPSELAPREDLSDDGGHWYRWRRPDLQDQGAWTHQYGSAANNAFGGESLRGATSAEELRVQWFGRPGPRAQADRNGRKPSPLAVGNRLFVQGLHRITALNAYNGFILWTLEIPDFERFNIPRDSSNWCADEHHVFAAVRDRCWKINAADGQVEEFIPLPGGVNPAWKYDWGYVGRSGDLLLGSAVKSGSSRKEFWGGAGWYDDKMGEATFKVCSDRLFAIDLKDPSRRWSYAQGVVLNSTIVTTADRVYFVECRHPKVIAADTRRLGTAELWKDQHLVALDVKTGELVWERPIDTADGQVIFHLAAAGNRLVLLASEWQYHVYSFDAKTGESQWDQHFDWSSDNHGGHMSRPAIVGNRIFVRPYVLDLADGKVLPQRIPGGGCGSYAATDSCLVFRAGNVTMWDIADGLTTSWNRLRPDCWISTIPACGMLLSPEGGGGCSCGSWLETSIGFVPNELPPPRIAAPAPHFLDETDVKLSARGQGGVARYTLDGKDPDEHSPVYREPLHLRGTTTIKARTLWAKDKYGRPAASPVIALVLTRDYPGPTPSPNSIPFLDSLNVALARPGKTGVIRYTLDGSDPSPDAARYESPISIAATTKLKSRIIYEDGTLSPVVEANYTKVDSKPMPAVAAEGVKPGLICDSYLGNWQKLPVFADLKPTRTTVENRITLAPRPAKDAFGLRFQGFVKVPADGIYTFYARSDDGSRLFVGDRELVNNDGVHAAAEKSAWVALRAGLHPLRVEFWDAVWDEALEISYEGPGIGKQPLPAAALFHVPLPTP